MDMKEPPSTIKEVGIHIGYMRDDIQDLKILVENITKSFATKIELDDLSRRVRVLENRNGLKNTLLWVGLTASAIINIVVIYQLFVGKS